MNVLGIICARKGSKRLPGKHWLEIAGEPLFGYAFKVAEGSGCKFVVLSSDDRKMFGYWKKFAFKTAWHQRPAKLARDRTPIHTVLQDVVRRFLLGFPHDVPDAVAFLPANVPTVTAELINRTIEALEKNERATAAMTVRVVRDHPEWLWRAGGKFLRREFSSAKYRVQDLPVRYIATGSVNIVRLGVLLRCKSSAAYAWLGNRIVGVPDPGAVEVHDLADYKRAKEVLEP